MNVMGPAPFTHWTILIQSRITPRTGTQQASLSGGKRRAEMQDLGEVAQ